MNKKEVKIRIENLQKIIKYHRYLYHVLDRQEISDSALDSLKKELFDLEQRFPEFITPDSPTQRIGGMPLDKFKKVKHPEPMLSFNDAFSRKDLDDWLKRISKLLAEEETKQIDFFCELKIDGLAVELIYEKGILKTGSTRGDGIIGEDVTQNLKTVEVIPLRLKGFSSRDFLEKYKRIIVRGEVFISRNDFIEINKEREKAGLPVYANPRNLAAGSVRQLDSNITASRNLNFFVYDVPGIDLNTHKEKHDFLSKIGFKNSPHNKYCLDLKQVFSFYQKAIQIREQLSYEVDGIVVSINSSRIFEKLGVVGKSPRGAIALKFPPKQAVTIVKDIKVQVGRTGALTPVAVLKTVKVGGVDVSRATLHNEDEIKKLNLKIGDTVIVGRAGDVIPDIIKVLPEMRTGKEKDFKMPEKCPICKESVKKEEVIYYCQNPGCFAILKRRFYHFVSRPAFDIDGLGPKIIDRLIDKGLLLDPADIFLLKKGDLIPVERFAQKSAENLINSISARRKIELPRFIYALGIRGVGEETARDLSAHFQGLGNLKKSKKQDLQSIKDIGPIVASSIFNWFVLEDNKKFLKKLEALVNIQSHKAQKGKLEGRTFVFTGELSSMAREQAKEKVLFLGGAVSDSVSRKIHFLVLGKSPGSKLKKAERLGIKTINEREFLKIIE